MWCSNGSAIKMTEGDFGVELPIQIVGAELEDGDCVELKILSVPNGRTVLTLEFEDFYNNTVPFVLTEAQSALLPVGDYVYRLDWYRGENFLYNIIPKSPFTVVDKA